LGNKSQCSKLAKFNFEKSAVQPESKKMGKIKRLYGKSKSPSESLNKYMNIHGTDAML